MVNPVSNGDWQGMSPVEINSLLDYGSSEVLWDYCLEGNIAMPDSASIIFNRMNRGMDHFSVSGSMDYDANSDMSSDCSSSSNGHSVYGHNYRTMPYFDTNAQPSGTNPRYNRWSRVSY